MQMLILYFIHYTVILLSLDTKIYEQIARMTSF